MSKVDREIPQRELRNDVSAVLREVDAGARLRVTVRGRPVADIVPVERRRTWVPRSELERIRRDAPLDPGFRRDLDEAAGWTIDEL